MTKTKININELSFTYILSNGSDKLDVINNISLDINEGEFITIIGPSGCGKTTLLKLIGGLNFKYPKPIITGTILIDNKTPATVKNEGKISFAFQNPVLLPWRNIFNNVLLPFELEGDSKYHKIEANNILQLMGVSDFKYSYPHELSGGMKQRVNLARALINNPDLLLLDEPFGSLDEITRSKLNFELLKITKTNKQTAILITHSLREALLLGDRIIIMSKRPAKVIEIFKPSYTCSKSSGIESDEQFNIDLKKLANITLKQDISI